MNKYQNGKIYKITDIGYNKCYVGSTTENLSMRMARHRSEYRSHNDGKKLGRITVYNLFDEFGVENCKIELVEAFKCENRSELLKREGYHIQANDCVNNCVLEGRNQNVISFTERTTSKK